jgi:hypothetical protein
MSYEYYAIPNEATCRSNGPQSALAERVFSLNHIFPCLLYCYSPYKNVGFSLERSYASGFK